jgi:NAD(P)-dependent dehydrogenase (short-subunit alcohol dehydrogenase family)
MCGFQQPTIPPIPSHIDLTGQTIVVTGATGGLGYETSRQLLQLKASTLVLGVRNLDKGIAARTRLLEDNEVRRVNPNAVVKVLQLNLVDFKSVVAFADQVVAETKRLDALLLNAGINLARFEMTRDGHEMCVPLSSFISRRVEASSGKSDTCDQGFPGNEPQVNEEANSAQWENPD